MEKGSNITYEVIILEEETDSNTSSKDDVVDRSYSKPSSHGATSSGNFFSGGSLDSERKVDLSSGYPGTLHNLYDRIPMPYFTSVYDSSCLADKNCSDKVSTKKTFITSHTSIKNIKEEKESKHNGFNNTHSLSPKISPPKVSSTNIKEEMESKHNGFNNMGSLSPKMSLPKVSSTDIKEEIGSKHNGFNDMSYLSPKISLPKVSSTNIKEEIESTHNGFNNMGSLSPKISLPKFSRTNIKEEIESKHDGFINMSSLSPKISLPKVSSTNIKEEMDRKHGFNNMSSLSHKICLPNVSSTINLDDDDDDPDICILEDMSQPPHKKRCHVDEKPNVSGKWSSPSASTTQDGYNHTSFEDMSQPPPKKRCHVDEKSNVSGKWSSPSASTTQDGYNHTSFEKKDEQSVYRAALEDLAQPTSEATPPDGALAVPLMKHQRIALSWMVQKETRNMHCVGGILADDQGLGKTISTIALILTERSPASSKVGAPEVKKEMPETSNLHDVDQEDVTKHGKHSINIENSIQGTKSRLNAGTLIVCPTSVIRQWYDELHNKVSAKSRLSVLIYHGTNRTKDPAELTKYDVVLTTYAIVSMEVPVKPVEEDCDKDDYNDFYRPASSTKKRKLSKKAKKGAGKWVLESSLRPLAKMRWFRVVLDEAQIIKNHRTKASRACSGLKAKRRWCLSGTPIQNAIGDLYSYFRFLRYDPYDELATFRSTIKNPINRDPEKGYKKLQAILTTMLLRRTKATLIDGKRIISLPPKTVNMEELDFTGEELEFYTDLEEKSRSKFQEYSDAGTLEQNYASILVMLLRLRQACGHPLLVTGSSSSQTLESSLEEAKQLLPEKRNRLLSCLDASSAICGICGDPPEDAVVTTCEHVFCNQCILERLSTDDCECPSSGCKAQLDPSLVFSRSTLQIATDGCSSSVKAEPLDHYISNDAVNSSKIEAARALKSSKITAAMEYIHSIVDPSVRGIVAGEKAIVFSQWTKMLDLFEACLRDSSIGFRRLDGTMSIPERDKAVKDFNKLPNVSVMIMSLKAASLGLNMVAANHVILLDLWWNPTTEEQAIDRAHRIGQTRPVEVLRLTVKDTIEDRILELQKKKRAMVASAFGEDEAGRPQTRLTVNDLKYLFGFY